MLESLKLMTDNFLYLWWFNYYTSFADSCHCTTINFKTSQRRS